MEAKLSQIMDEAIKLELMMHKLYKVFIDQFPEDEKFWEQLAAEELNHAETIRKITPFLYLDQEMEEEMLTENLDNLVHENKRMLTVIDGFKQNPDRAEAFKVAIELEKNASEIHYQSFLEKSSNSQVASVFRSLTGNDKNHAQRIENYMKLHL